MRTSRRWTCWPTVVAQAGWLTCQVEGSDLVMSDLKGIRVALLEGRMSSELAGLVQRHHGEPYCVPAVREIPLECEEQVAHFINTLSDGSLQIVVFLTGAGAKALFQEAERLGRLGELLTALRGVTTVCRGPKPVAVLRDKQVPISVSAPEPHTTVELLEALAPIDLNGKGVAVVHYGERNAALAEALQAHGCRLEELCLYEWCLPEDVGALETLVRDILDGRVDAVAITSQVQIRHLFLVATEMEQAGELTQALNTRTIVASIGPTSTAALQSFGVTPQVVPEHPKMGQLVIALAQYMEKKNTHARPA